MAGAGGVSVTKFKIVVNIVTLVALAWLVYASRDQIQATVSQLPDLVWWPLILQVPVQLIGYGTIAHLYHSYFGGLGLRLRLKIQEMYKIALELNFVNSVFPSGGVSGFSYLSLRLRPFGVSFAASTLAQSVRFLLTFITLLPLLGIGLLFLAFGQAVEGWALLAGGGAFLALLAGTLAFVYLVSSRRRIKRLVTWLPKAVNGLARLLRCRPGRELINLNRVERFLDEIHADYKKISQNPSALKKPGLYALLYNILELLTIYLVFLAFGVAVNPGVLVLAYAVANFTGLIAILPAGIGAYEPLMIYILAESCGTAGACGVSYGVAITGTIAYRVLNMLIAVPAGYFFYSRAVNRLPGPAAKP